MSSVVAFDPSTKVLGWACMDTDTGLVVACGVENIDAPDGGWRHDQVRAAVNTVHNTLDQDPDGWTYERPFAVRVDNAFRYGETCRSLETVCRAVWPHAIVWDPYQPSSWRSLVGAGKRGKEGPRRVAEAIAGRTLASQDEADAVCVARALLIDKYDFGQEDAA